MLSKAKEIARIHGLEPETVERIDSHGPEKRKNYKVGNREVFYISVYPENSLTRTRTEAKIYELIGNNTSLRTPEVIEYSKDYILVRGLSGESYAPVFEKSSEERKLEIIRSHAEALIEIHGIEVLDIGEDVDGFGRFTDEGFHSYSSWTEFMEERLSSYTERASGELEEHAINWLRENIRITETDIQPRIVHDDFHIWNTLTGETIGVLDAEQAFIGDSVYDLVKTASRWTDNYGMTEELLETYLGKHDIEDFEKRFRYYRVENYLRGTINAREKVENGQNELQKFYENDREKLVQLIRGE